MIFLIVYMFFYDNNVFEAQDIACNYHLLKRRFVFIIIMCAALDTNLGAK